jgi:uncharacterized protein YjbI with pentapeptide repeats
VADEEQLRIIRQGVAAWNGWRKKNPELRPNLSRADLSGLDLSGANLRKARLRRANLSWVCLCSADLSRADLCKANLSEGSLTPSGAAFTTFNRQRDTRLLTSSQLSYWTLTLDSSTQYVA